MKNFLLATICSLGLVPGCVAPQERFAPAPGALTAKDLDSAVVDADNGFWAIVQVEAWDGDVVLRNDLTPIKVILQNTGTRPALVRLSDIALVARSGRHYAPLEPSKVTGSAPMVLATPIYSPDGRTVGNSRYDYPYGQAPSYPTIYANRPPFPADTGTPLTYHGSTKTVDLPTPYMRQAALEEGELAAGAEQVGFVYFPLLPEPERSFRVVVALRAADDHRVLARLSFPFVAKD